MIEIDYKNCDNCKYEDFEFYDEPCVGCRNTIHDSCKEYPNTPFLWEPKEQPDNVNHPAHYETGKYECIEVMLETQGKETVKAYCLCAAFKYLYRHNRKNGLEDIKKARWYLDKYVELEEGEADDKV